MIYYRLETVPKTTESSKSKYDEEITRREKRPQPPRKLGKTSGKWHDACWRLFDGKAFRRKGVSRIFTDFLLFLIRVWNIGVSTSASYNMLVIEIVVWCFLIESWNCLAFFFFSSRGLKALLFGFFFVLAKYEFGFYVHSIFNSFTVCQFEFRRFINLLFVVCGVQFLQYVLHFSVLWFAVGSSVFHFVVGFYVVQFVVKFSVL